MMVWMRLVQTPCVVITMLTLVWLVGLSGGATPTPLLNAQGTPLPPLNPTEVRRGKAIYQVHCASCHGANAEGAPNWQKRDAEGNFPPPPHDDSGHTWHHPDRVLFEIIRDGFADPLRPGAPKRMPPFGDKLSDADMRAVVAFFKSLWSAEHRAFQWEATLQDGTLYRQGHSVFGEGLQIKPKTS